MKKRGRGVGMSKPLKEGEGKEERKERRKEKEAYVDDRALST